LNGFQKFELIDCANHFVLHFSQGVAIGPEYAATAWREFCWDDNMAFCRRFFFSILEASLNLSTVNRLKAQYIPAQWQRLWKQKTNSLTATPWDNNQNRLSKIHLIWLTFSGADHIWSFEKILIAPLGPGGLSLSTIM